MPIQSECHLLNLPPELRHRIWSLLLVHERHFAVDHEATLANQVREADLQLQVLLLSKFVYGEAIDILYGDNLFLATKHAGSYSSPGTKKRFKAWLRKVGPTNLARMKYLVIQTQSTLHGTMCYATCSTILRLVVPECRVEGYLDAVRYFGKVRVPDHGVNKAPEIDEVMERMQERKAGGGEIVIDDILEIYKHVPRVPYKQGNWVEVLHAVSEKLWDLNDNHARVGDHEQDAVDAADVLEVEED